MSGLSWVLVWVIFGGLVWVAPEIVRCRIFRFNRIARTHFAAWRVLSIPEVVDCAAQNVNSGPVVPYLSELVVQDQDCGGVWRVNAVSRASLRGWAHEFSIGLATAFCQVGEFPGEVL
jgi:hypothetical protein